MKQSARGFTLLEVLIAIAIFALLGLGSYRMLHSVLNTDEATRRHELQLREVVRAFAVLEQDLAQVGARPVRDGYADLRPALLGEAVEVGLHPCCHRLPIRVRPRRQGGNHTLLVSR